MQSSVRHCAFDASLFVMALISAPLSAQQAAQPPMASAPAATAGLSPSQRPAPPSQATIKKARAAGLKAETRNGMTVFCWQDANTGSRFNTKKCVDETRLELILQERQDARDRFKQGGTSRN
jgi:hypothetical protein